MKNLAGIWKELSDAGFETDKGSVHGYVPIYEEFFAPYRKKPVMVLELGLFSGHSLRMWDLYFICGEVHGVDCDEQPHGGMADLRPMIQSGEYHIHIMDATSEEQVDAVFGETKWNIVIDDFNHNTPDQVKAFNIFKTRMAPGALYCIEDPQQLDQDEELYMSLHDNVETVDLRKETGRYDDAIIFYKF